ncbi:hypothetical protein MAPG_11947 [Magnaporthiopsis poae ATCC 64411]|uniref:Uncharacterized protein n=1 Tax=Magnaporthiopsis poae (strain ATCC 64411 / 73-15) TaxID=644358 RepID=A0A0C4EGJ4_MAGP6|nr:hypothetical protein MAPG_11947 [Magnaporthiopsis poae ATCC 64411]
MPASTRNGHEAVKKPVTERTKDGLFGLGGCPRVADGETFEGFELVVRQRKASLFFFRETVNEIIDDPVIASPGLSERLVDELQLARLAQEVARHYGWRSLRLGWSVFGFTFSNTNTSPFHKWPAPPMRTPALLAPLGGCNPARVEITIRESLSPPSTSGGAVN